MQPQKNIPSPDSDLPLLAAIKLKDSSPRYRPPATDTPTAGAQRRIGIAVDLSDESAFAVKWAVHHYLRPGDAVILLYVPPTSVLYGADWGSVAGSDEESHKKLEDEFHNFTTTKASDLSQPLVIAHIPFKIHIVKDHDMKERLCLEVERLGLSAVIMGSRGFGSTNRGSSGRLGSVSDYCVHHCVCPVVVVRYTDEKDGSGADADTGEPLGKMAAVAEVEDEPGKQDADAAEDHKGKGPAGVCMMSNAWRDEQHPSFINFISSFLGSNSFRLNFVRIAPDFIFNCGGLSVAFIFVTDWRSNNTTTVFSRIQKLKGQFAHIFVVVVLPTAVQNDSFIHCYFKYGMELGRPTFIPVQDLEMGFEKIVKLAHARGVCKRQDVISKLKADRERSVQEINIFLKLVTSIPSIQNHDANANELPTVSCMRIRQWGVTGKTLSGNRFS